MNDDIKRLRKLADTYKLSRPVPPELQQYVISNRMPDLRDILMKSGKYSLISWFVIMIFSLFRKYGLHITMIQSKIIAGITAAAVASGSAAVAYRGVKYVIETKARPASQTEETIENPQSGTDMKIEEPSSVAPPTAPAEQTRTEQKHAVPVLKERAPAEIKQPGKEKQEKAKKKGDEHNTLSDIPSL